MRSHTDMFQAIDNTGLFEQLWWPDDDPVGVLAIAHGYSEHSGRYAHLARALTQNGYAAELFDLRGHGRSKGRRGYVGNFEHYLSDLRQFIIRIKKRHPDRPVFLFGHSLGGAIATLYAIHNPVHLNGLLLSGAALTFGVTMSAPMRSFVSIVGRFVPNLPTIPMGNGAIITSNPNAIQNYNSDPLVYRNRVPARTAAQTVWAIRQIQANMRALSLPLLIMHGTNDIVTDLEGSRQLYRRARSTDKTLALYDGLSHSLLEEADKDTVINGILAWLRSRTPTAPTPQTNTSH